MRQGDIINKRATSLQLPAVPSPVFASTHGGWPDLSSGSHWGRIGSISNHDFVSVEGVPFVSLQMTMPVDSFDVSM